MSYHVIILPDAERELEEAYRWVREEAPHHADKWLDGLLAARDSLSEFPERCSLAPENEHFREEIRQLLYGKRGGRYRLLFTIERDTVFILPIRHAARDTVKPPSPEQG
jgi:plasmid stabilization system protein ParE